MTITSPVSPLERALSPVVEAGSKLETEPGTIDVSWAERALRDAEGPKEVTLRETAARHRWLKLLAMAVVLCACTATGAVTNQTSPIPTGTGAPTPGGAAGGPSSARLGQAFRPEACYLSRLSVLAARAPRSQRGCRAVRQAVVQRLVVFLPPLLAPG